MQQSVLNRFSGRPRAYERHRNGVRSKNYGKAIHQEEEKSQICDDGTKSFLESLTRSYRQAFLHVSGLVSFVELDGMDSYFD